MELDLLNLLFVLLAAWLAGNVAEHFRYPSVLGELVVGIVLGPPVLGLLHGSEALDVLAELGILIMMLYIGMEIDPRGLAKASWAGLLAAVGGFVTPFVLAYFVVLWFGGSMFAGLFVGIAAGITSLITKSRILVDLQLLDTRVAHVMMTGALVSDTMALIAFAAILGVVDVGSVDLGGIALVAAKAILFFGASVAVGYKVFPWIGRRLTSSGLTKRTFHFTFVLLIAVSFAQLAEWSGLHSILGAFIAGVFLRDEVLGPTLARDLTKAVRDASLGLLAPIFFVTAGFDVSFSVFVGSNLWLFLAIMAVAMGGKVLGTVLFYLPTGYGWREGLTVGLGMNGRGAVEIIVAGIGLERGLISQEIFSILVFMAIFTTSLVPVFLKWGTDWLRSRGELVRGKGERRGTVIVGAGPMGRLLGRHLNSTRPVWLLDSNAEQCRLAEVEGLTAHLGDALQEQDLSVAGAAEADSLVALTTNAAVNALVARMAKEVFEVPRVFIVQVAPAEAERDGELRHLAASILFGGPVPREEWEHRVAVGDYLEADEEIEEATTGSAFRDLVYDRDRSLPLIIRRGEDSVPLHARSKLNPGDRVVLLRPVQRRESGPPAVRRAVAESPVLDVEGPLDVSEFFELAAAEIADGAEQRQMILQALRAREKAGSTVLAPGLAVPHIGTPVAGAIPMLIARVRQGTTFPGTAEPVHAIFLLIRTLDHPTLHLQALATIAQAAGRPDFQERWLAASDADELRQLLLETGPPVIFDPAP